MFLFLDSLYLSVSFSLLLLLLLQLLLLLLLLPLLRRSATWVTGSPKKASLPDSSLLAAMRKISPPKTATEARSFLGLAGYYRRYVKGFAAITGPLHALTRKDAVFHWSTKCQAAFDQLKHLLTTSRITAFPDFSQAFPPLR